MITPSMQQNQTTARTVNAFTAGTIEDTISGLAISWDAGTNTVSWSGSLAYVYDATVTRVNGTKVMRCQEGTILFSGLSTFTGSSTA